MYKCDAVFFEAGAGCFSNRLTYAAICGLIASGGEPPAILTLVMNQPPGVAAPLTGAFSLPVYQETQKARRGILFVDICMGYV